MTPSVRLEARAIAELRHERADPGAAWEHSLALVVVEPAFHLPLAYEAFRDRGGRLRARRTIWRRDVDRERVSPFLMHVDLSPEELVPTFEVAEGMLDEEEFQRAVAELAATRLPGYPPAGEMGLDGVTFELALTVGWVWTRYRWWHSPPREWEPLATFVRRFLALSERAVEATDASPPA